MPLMASATTIMLRNGNDENFKAKESLRGKCLRAPARKQTAVMKKQLTTRANSYEFFSKKSPQSTNDSTRLMLVAVELAFPENIGALIRIAGNIGCEKVIFICEQSNFKSKKIQRAATDNAYMNVPFEFCSEKEWPTKIPKEYQRVAVETVSHATNVYQTVLPQKICLVVGNESFGITEWSLQQCETAVYLPMPGRIKSLPQRQSSSDNCHV